MPGHDIIVIGASAGGVEALMQVARDLPADLPAAVFVVLHVPPYGGSALPRILDRISPLKVTHAENNEVIAKGHVYVAPPDYHMLLAGRRIRLSRGPTENGTRPAIDPLFRSAAAAYGPRVIGVVLSGSLDDGTAGMIAVKRQSGIAVAQDPEEAVYPSMPSSAIENAPIDFVCRIAEVGPLLARLASEPARTDPQEGLPPMPEKIEEEVAMDAFDPAALHKTEEDGPPSSFTCPECNGALWEMHDGELIRYRCRVGHAYSADTLIAHQAAALEAALWQAYRSLKESAALSHRLASRARERGHSLAARRFEEQATIAEQRSDIVRGALIRENPALEEDQRSPVAS